MSHLSRSGGSIEDKARAHLRELAGPNAEFRRGQLEAIVALVERRGRVLLVQRTGFGKSAVYFIATRLLREAGVGPTLLFSPLLALMRNQSSMAERVGVAAATLNSANRDEWESIEGRLRDDELDVLLISPERLGNPTFREEIFDEVLSRAGGLVVIDEVHCISDWGHDFRPDYQRLGNVLASMPAEIPVLGTTATANSRVIADVEQQLGDDLETFRGPLDREGLRLIAMPRWNKSERLAWMAGAIHDLPGSGIIYCLTIDDTEQVADWLLEQGITAVPYSGSDQRVARWLNRRPEIGASASLGWSGADADARICVEQALLDNTVKVVVGTSALGMGFDKPDLGFVIHYQSPGSPIAYYQQVGRAGRALDESIGVMLRGHEDSDIQDYFIDNAFPDEEQVEAVLAALAADGPLSIGRIEVEVNLRRTRLDQLLKQLEVDGIIRKVKGGWERTSEPWFHDAERVRAVTALRRHEQAEMEAYAESDRCLMSHLRELLDDEAPESCGRCSTCAPDDPLLTAAPPAELVASATRFVRRRVHRIEARRQWPTGLEQVRGRIAEDRRPLDGRALCRIGDAGWWPTVERLLAGASPDPLGTGATAELGHAVIELIETWAPSPRPGWVAAIPSDGRPRLVAELAELIGDGLGLPVIPLLDRVEARPAQAMFDNGAQKCRNVLDAFEVVEEPPPGCCLLIDELVDSGWTVTVVTDQLLAAGVEAVTPFVLAKAGG